MYETIGQTYAFGLMAASGFLAGGVIHMCLAYERLMRAGRLLTVFTDFVCVGLTAALLVFSMLISVKLEFRLYIFLSAAFGSLIYFVLAAPLLEKIVYSARKKIRLLCRSDNLKKICQILCR